MMVDVVNQFSCDEPEKTGICPRERDGGRIGGLWKNSRGMLKNARGRNVLWKFNGMGHVFAKFLKPE